MKGCLGASFEGSFEDFYRLILRVSFQGSKVNLRLLKGSRGYRVLKGFYDGLGDFSVAFVGLVVGCLWDFGMVLLSSGCCVVVILSYLSFPWSRS